MTLDWYSKEPKFCEGYLNSHEYANSFTSHFIMLIGIYGIYFNEHPDSYIRHYFSLFIINGVASVVFHWNLEKGWGLLDAYPMLILAYSGLFFAFDIILHKEFINKLQKDWLYQVCSSVLATLTNSLMIFTLVHTALYGQQTTLFVMFFAFPILSIVVCNFVIWFVYYHEYKESNPNLVNLQSLLIRALIIGVVTGGAWLSTELLCEDEKWMRYLYMHTIWHIGFSYSMYCFLIYVIFI